MGCVRSQPEGKLSETARGELRISRHGDPQLGSPRLAAIAKTRKSFADDDQPFRASDEIQMREAERIIRAALTTGKPALSQNLAGALSFLSRTGTVPPEAFRDPRPLVRL